MNAAYGMSKNAPAMTEHEVLAAMHRGATLHLQHTEEGNHFWLQFVALDIDADVAAAVIEDPMVIRRGDALFDDALPQTYVIER